MSNPRPPSASRACFASDVLRDAGEQLGYLGLVRQAEDPLHDRDEIFCPRRNRRVRNRFGHAVVPAQGAQRIPHRAHRVTTHVTPSAPGALEIWAHGSHVEAKELKNEFRTRQRLRLCPKDKTTFQKKWRKAVLPKFRRLSQQQKSQRWLRVSRAD